MSLILKLFKNEYSLNIYWIVLILLILYLVYNRKNAISKKLLISMGIFLALYPIWHLALGDPFYRLMWLFPIFVIISFGGVKLLNTKKRNRGILTVLILVTYLLVFGNNICSYFNDSLQADNTYHIDQNVVDVADLIIQDTSEEMIRVVGEGDFMVQVRLYSPKFYWGYSTRVAIMFADRRLAENASYRVATAIQTGYFEVGMDIVEDLKELGVEYIVLNKGNECLNGCEYAYNIIGETETYRIYKMK